MASPQEHVHIVERQQQPVGQWQHHRVLMIGSVAMVKAGLAGSGWREEIDEDESPRSCSVSIITETEGRAYIDSCAR